MESLRGWGKRSSGTFEQRVLTLASAKEQGKIVPVNLPLCDGGGGGGLLGGGGGGGLSGDPGRVIASTVDICIDIPFSCSASLREVVFDCASCQGCNNRCLSSILDKWQNGVCLLVDEEENKRRAERKNWQGIIYAGEKSEE